jgi:lysylphosphatidylglycerol synthetase-like protein (DUF2156 family)
MREPIEPIILAIAVFTLITLAYLPMLFTRPRSAFQRINVFACGALALLLVPSIFHEWFPGLAMATILWGFCWVMVILSRNAPAQRTSDPSAIEEADIEVTQLASAVDKIQILERLAKMRSEGSLTSEEFNAEKRRIFG